jgi:hypothetical protein
LTGFFSSDFVVVAADISERWNAERGPDQGIFGGFVAWREEFAEERKSCQMFTDDCRGLEGRN